ncbi:MAG: hypothetical protein WCB46_03840 [Methanoregula sp.]
MPDKLTIDAALVIATVAAICRTISPAEGNFREDSFISGSVLPSKSTPGQVRSFTRHI